MASSVIIKGKQVKNKLAILSKEPLMLILTHHQPQQQCSSDKPTAKLHLIINYPQTLLI